jgi:hypothetical protein
MHITAFVKRLQSGEIDVSKINKYRDRGSRQWQEEMKRATDATLLSICCSVYLSTSVVETHDVRTTLYSLCDLASMSPSSPVFIR